MYGGRWVERCGNKEGDLRFGGGDGWEDLWCTVVAELVLKMVLCLLRGLKILFLLFWIFCRS